MKLYILIPLLIFFSAFAEADVNKKEDVKESCRYIIRFDPEVSKASAKEILKRYHLRVVHTYETLSSASGSLIVAADSDFCTDSLEKRVAADPMVNSIQPESRKSTLTSGQPRKGGEAYSFSLPYALFFFFAFLLISFYGLHSKEQIR